MDKNLRENFANKFAAARAQTLRIFDLASEDVLRQSPGFGFRPIMWHLAHLGTFEEYWLLSKIKGAEPLNQHFQSIFDPIKTPRENSKDLPTKAEMLNYLGAVRDQVWLVLENFDFAANDPLLKNGYVFDLVHQHELQHQETLAYLFHLLPPMAKMQSPELKTQNLKSNKQSVTNAASIEIAAGDFIIGASGNEFAYDNEMPSHQLFIPAFGLDPFLTTNAEFAEFIAERGYERNEFWSIEGWQFREKENLNAPLYWLRTESGWTVGTMFARQALANLANFPVYGLSFYEAEAYANYRKKRLPTEFEWEKAAALNKFKPENSNYGWHFGETTPVNHFTNESFADLSGNLWEWTSSDFAGYPNFAMFPYEDYSEKWFDGDHMVLKGGSFVTSKEMLRLTFRNFFRRSFRLAFAGIRLATDI